MIKHLRIRRSNIYNLHFFQWWKNVYCSLYFIFLVFLELCAPSKDCNWLEILHRMLRMKIQWVFFSLQHSIILSKFGLDLMVCSPSILCFQWRVGTERPPSLRSFTRWCRLGQCDPWHGERKRKCHEGILAEMINLGSKSWDMSSWATTRIFC